MVHDVCILWDGVDSTIPMYIFFYFSQRGYHACISHTEHDESLLEYVAHSSVVIPIISSSFKNDLVNVSALALGRSLGKDIVPVLCDIKEDWCWLNNMFGDSITSALNKYVDLSDISDFLGFATEDNSDDDDGCEDEYIVDTINKRISEVFISTSSD